MGSFNGSLDGHFTWELLVLGLNWRIPKVHSILTYILCLVDQLKRYCMVRKGYSSGALLLAVGSEQFICAPFAPLNPLIYTFLIYK